MKTVPMARQAMAAACIASAQSAGNFTIHSM